MDLWSLLQVGVGLDLAEPARSAYPETPYDSLPAPAAATESDTYETFADLVSVSDLDLGSCVTLGLRQPCLHALGSYEGVFVHNISRNRRLWVDSNRFHQV